ncbi:MAG: DUF302 domain-containing protein [Gammaproteobacteria bacterium]|nr:DUF302 domain-containing protein [Gammaproteobacteria bacterium]
MKRANTIRSALLLAGLLLGVAGTPQAAEGLISVKSAHDVPTTVQRLVDTLGEKGMKVFAVIDHQAGARAAEMDLAPTTVVIFGNPKVGTPLMGCARSVAIDLPQKALVWQAEDGSVWLGYNDPQYLNARHGLGDCQGVLDKVKGALSNFAQAATRP